MAAASANISWHDSALTEEIWRGKSRTWKTLNILPLVAPKHKKIKISCVFCHLSCVTCHVSHVMCHMSRVTCQMLCVTCHMSLMATAIAMDHPPASSPSTMHSSMAQWWRAFETNNKMSSSFSLRHHI